jgi:hypothetical protein
MADETTRTIAQIKLDEMRRQRDRLNDHYAALEARAAAAAPPMEKLQLLHDGLRQVQFAQKRFHPDVANLDAVLPTRFAAGSTSPWSIRACRPGADCPRPCSTGRSRRVVSV